ncbi:MAG: Gfo/Idh/MocA family oxidoreductase [Desulfatiglans sp.]|nr:Gfo/Idh/MocA family oxidoreductase [Desulfatiglans sp.]
MGDLVKVAVCGAGYWGKNLVRNFEALKVLGKICDSNQETREAFLSSYPHVTATDSYKDILDDASYTAVAVATPAETHYRMVKEALQAGKHVFVEKPLALLEEEGIELHELAQERKRVLMVGHLLQYHPAVVRLKQLVSEGDLGKIQYIYSNRLNLGKIRREENILWSFAPHDISVILALTGEMPERVISSGANYLHQKVADVTLSNLSFPSGVKAHVFVSWLHPYKEQRLVVVGDRKMALFNDVEPEDKLLLYPHKIEWKDHMPMPEKKEAQKVSVENKEPLREECLHFIECVKSGLKPRTDGEEALRVLKVLQACQDSLEQGGAPVLLSKGPGELGGKNVQIHETAIIDPGCSIGTGTRIWHFTHVIKGSTIGRDCNIGQNVVIGPDVIIGNSVKIQNNVSVYPGVTLEDGVFCGPSMVFTNVYNPRSHIPRKSEIRHTLVKEGATLGANCTILCGHTIGRFAFVGAGAVVLHNVPDFALVGGNPAVIKGWMCRCGVRLHFEDAYAVCDVCGARYEKKDEGVRESMS